MAWKGLVGRLLVDVWEVLVLGDICLEVCCLLPQKELDERGLTLTGGLSFLSSQYGWGASNVVDFEVVLANSTVVHANNKENTGKQTNTSTIILPNTYYRPLQSSEGRW